MVAELRPIDILVNNTTITINLTTLSKMERGNWYRKIRTISLEHSIASYKFSIRGLRGKEEGLSISP